MSTLAVKLKALRKNAKLTQKELTDELSLKKTAISNIENRNMEPPLDTLLKLSQFFNVSIDFLVGNIDNSESKNIKESLKEDTQFYNSLMTVMRGCKKRNMGCIIVCNKCEKGDK